LVLRRFLPGLTRRTWVVATILGAGVAWVVGMTLGTLVSDLIGAEASQAALLFAGALGFLVGALLGLFQWLVLRRYLQDAGWWVLANAVAWMAGMAVIFAALGIVDETTPVATTAAVWAVSGLLAGVFVAAIHGLVLIGLLRHNRSASEGGN
jgi:hypothetical protein